MTLTDTQIADAGGADGGNRGLELIKEDFLEGYLYRKKATISNEIIEYQRKITLHKGSGTDSNTDVYNVKCRDDFTDIRFTEADKLTELSYWIESSVSGDYAVVWVKLPSEFVEGFEYIFLYYGNSEATDSSSGADTFIIFDDCEGTDPLDIWTENDSSWGDVIYTSAAAKYGTKSMKITQTATGTGEFYRIGRDTFDYDSFIIDFWIKAGATDNRHYHRSASDVGIWTFRLRWDIDAKLQWFNGTSYQDTGYTYTTNWEHHVLTCTASDKKVKWERDDVEIGSDVHEGDWTRLGTFDLHVGDYNYAGDYAYYDRIIIRKYSATPPTFSWDAETTQIASEGNIKIEFDNEEVDEFVAAVVYGAAYNGTVDIEAYKDTEFTDLFYTYELNSLIDLRAKSNQFPLTFPIEFGFSSDEIGLKINLFLDIGEFQPPIVEEIIIWYLVKNEYKVSENCAVGEIEIEPQIFPFIQNSLTGAVAITQVPGREKPVIYRSRNISSMYTFTLTSKSIDEVDTLTGYENIETTFTTIAFSDEFEIIPIFVSMVSCEEFAQSRFDLNFTVLGGEYE